MSEALRVLVVGGGDMAGKHADAYTRLKNLSLCGVVDIDEHRRRDFVARYNVPAFFSEYREALEACKPDIVSVCVPVFLHSEVSIAALAAGAHVLCEKPIALTLKDADAMIAAADSAPGRLGIVLQRRWSPVWRAAHERLPQLGNPLTYFATDFRRIRPKVLMHSKSGNGGPIIDCAVHDFDMVTQWFGPVESVYATGSIYAAGKAEIAMIQDLAIDTATVQLDFANGHRAAIAYGWGMPVGFQDYVRNEIIGPNGMVRVFADKLEHQHPDGRVETLAELSSEGHAEQIAAFVQALRDGKPVPADPRDARNALAVSLAALQSIESGEVIRLDAIPKA